MIKLIKIIASASISFAVLALLLNMVTAGLAENERPSVIATLQKTSIDWLLIGVIIYLITLMIRAWRYQLLIKVSGSSIVPTMKQMALVTGIRNMFVDMLPARLGELGYIGLLNKGYNVKLQHCVTSLVSTVVFDFVAMFAVVILVVMKQFAGVEGVQGWAWFALLFSCLLAVIGLFVLFYLVPVINPRVQQRFGQQFDIKSFPGKCLHLMSQVSDSLVIVRQSGRMRLVLAQSLLIRILKYTSFYCLFMAVALPSFQQLSEIPSEQIVSALIGGEIAASLPSPTLLGFGAYEAGGTLVFQLLGLTDMAAGLITLLGVHIWSQVMEYLLGGLLLIIFVVTVKARKNGNNGSKRKVSVLWLMLAAFAFVFISVLLALELRATKKIGALAAPKTSGASVIVDAGIKEKFTPAFAELDGFVVWSSNRNGNHDIYKMSLPNKQITQLTTHPHTETYPRISPNGQSIAFSRAHEVWVSQRNKVAWDIYTLNITTGEEKLIARNGTSPRWLSNDEISYVQQKSRLVQVNVNNTNEQSLLFAGQDELLPKGARLDNAAIDPNTKTVVFSGKQDEIGVNDGFWGTALVRNNKLYPVLNGCELTFSNDYSELFQIATDNARQGTKIVQIDTETLKPTTLIDLQGEFSREYWPKDASNGKYIIFGASRGRAHHEHDTKDYELFLWQKGSDPGEAVRLTHHTGNDNWPDIFLK